MFFFAIAMSVRSLSARRTDGLEVDRLRPEVGTIDRIELRAPVRIGSAGDDEPLERELGGALCRLRGDERLAPRRLL